MKVTLHAIREQDYRRLRAFLPPAGPGGVWMLGPGPGGAPVLRVAAPEGERTGARTGAVVLVPTEQVLLTIVDLPLAARRQRLAALPFAIEDRIAEPIESVHAALGIATGPGRYLAGVVARATMAGWVARVEAAGLGHAVLIPDALALPLPPEGAWSVARTADRVVVRTPDGGGFAVPTARFAGIWTMAGRPDCILYGEALPDGIAGVAAVDGVADAVPATVLDLRQGVFARVRRGTSALWRRAAIVAGCGLLAHGAIAAADTIALQRIAADRKADTAAIVERIAPGTSTSGDLAEVAGDLLPSGNATPGATFVPMMGRISQAMGAGVTLRSLAYDAGAGTIVLDVSAPDLAAVQGVEARMRAAGLVVSGGGGTAAAGGAEGQITVQTRANASVSATGEAG
ncbi:type II secretion system protein GspL [Sphingomonas montana]|uniref:type II secretion system protein GspL n=1 Tax=Sphingomonas montana TaxID=1843236 RepID=UPI00096E3B71|nr:type II secretion system protein GspL [Sphingomonas montana]